MRAPFDITDPTSFTALYERYRRGVYVGDGDDTRTVAAEVDRARAPQASGSLLVSEDTGDKGAVLRVHGLPETAGEQVYVIWLQRGNEVVPESSFNVRPDGSGKGAVESVKGVDRVMVTRERSLAVRAPTEPPLVTVELS